MKLSQLVVLLTGIGTGLALLANPAQAQPSTNRPALEVIIDLKGKVCRSKSGARFSFSLNGRYAHDGQWQSLGAYELGDRSAITLDSVLKRGFALSLRGGILQLEESDVACSEE